MCHLADSETLGGGKGRKGGGGGRGRGIHKCNLAPPWCLLTF